MSWRLILSEYPDPLLKDQLALIVLVLLERGGLVKESELQAELAVEPRIIVEKLLALHHNKCIEYSRDHVKITERGRELVDRFALTNDIVDDLLNRLPASSRGSSRFKNLLLEYRRRHFDQYLESVTAVRAWSRASRMTSLLASERPESAEIGSLAILIWDFAQYLPDEPELQSFSFHGEHTSESPDERHNLFQLSDEQANRATGWAYLYKKIEKSSTPWEDIRANDSWEANVFTSFLYSRNALDTTPWLEAWTGESGCPVFLDASSSGREMSERCVGFWTTILPYASNSWRQNVMSHRHQTLSGALPFGNLADFLVKFFAATSMDQLMQTTKLNRKSLELLLAQIQRHCKSLCSPDELESLQNEERGHIEE